MENDDQQEHPSTVKTKSKFSNIIRKITINKQNFTKRPHKTWYWTFISANGTTLTSSPIIKSYLINNSHYDLHQGSAQKLT